MTCHKSMLDALQQQGVRLTAQRALILENLFHHPGHRTAEDIYQDVSERLPGLNRATVYRTLELLQGAGAVVAFPDRQGVTEFELVRSAEEMHHHLICRQCGRDYPLDQAPVERFKAEIRELTGFDPDLDHLVVGGLCARCQTGAQG